MRALLLCGALSSCCWAGRLPDEACDVLVVGGGAAAALAAKKGCSPRELPVAEIKAGLRTRGCIVPGNADGPIQGFGQPLKSIRTF